jgi:isopentenyl phosphate kinase
MNERSITVVKLGGSILTRKKEAERLRPKLLTRLSKEIAGGPGPIVLLHGAGSFGHPGALRFGLARAPPDPAPRVHRARGAAIVSAEVRRLHLAVLRALVAAGARPWSVPTATVASNRSGHIADLTVKPFTAAMDRGLVPVAFGDVVPDEDWQFSILSADAIAVELARRLPVLRVLFVSDVPGIYEPKALPEHQVVPEVDAALVDRLTPRGAGPDVTGGIRGKAMAMRAIAALGADAGLISGLQDGLLSRALRGEPVHGSFARASPG